jgi:N-methylhydantoinase A
VVLGRLDPEYFLGGEMTLDVDGARRAIEERCAGPLGIDVTQDAYGIVEIANAAMVNAQHLISVQSGYDPRDFVLVGFGGAGPVHANAIAREAEMPTLVVPPSPGIFSATGLLTTDLKRDAAVTVMRRLDELEQAELEEVFARLERAGAEELRREGVASDRIEFVRQLDVRYVGQSYELTVEAGGPAEPKETRPVYFAEAGDYVDCPIYDRYALGAGASLAGPAVVEEFDSTTVVHPGFDVRVDGRGNLVIERRAA